MINIVPFRLMFTSAKNWKRVSIYQSRTSTSPLGSSTKMQYGIYQIVANVKVRNLFRIQKQSETFTPGKSIPIRLAASPETERSNV
jgi:hypothetical protein